MARKVSSVFAVAVAVALSTSLYASVALAQSASPPTGRPAYGVTAGVNFANLGGSDVDNSDTRTGLVAGVYASWPIQNGFSFRPSVLYSMEGAKASDAGADATLKLDYIRVPVMFRYTWPMAGTSRPFVALGPSFGYQVKCEVTASFNGRSVTESCDTSAAGDSQRKKFDASGRAEAGLDFAMSGRALTIGGAYSYGFTDVATHADVKNRVFSIFLAIGL